MSEVKGSRVSRPAKAAKRGEETSSGSRSDVELTDRLLNAATDVFLEKGFSAASLDEIAARAKAGKITFYNHFGNKEALFEAIILRLSANLFHGFVAALEPDAPTEQALTLYLRHLSEVIHTDIAVKLVRVLHAEAQRFPRLAEIFDQSGPRRARALLGSYLQQRMDVGELRQADAAVAADQVIQMATGERSRLVLLGLTPNKSKDETEASIAAAIDTFMRAYRR